MNMSGASTSALSGMALAVTDGAASCDSVGIYAKVKEIRLAGNWYDDLQAIAIDNAGFTMDEGEQKTLQVIGVYAGGRTGILRNANLTFISSSEGITVGAHDGVVQAVTAGASGIITVSVTNKIDINAYASVSVNES